MTPTRQSEKPNGETTPKPQARSQAAEAGGFLLSAFRFLLCGPSPTLHHRLVQGRRRRRHEHRRGVFGERHDWPAGRESAGNDWRELFFGWRLLEFVCGAKRLARPRSPLCRLRRARRRFSWTPNTPGFVLQQSSSLSAALWTNSPSGSTNPATVPVSQPARFYRLTK